MLSKDPGSHTAANKVVSRVVQSNARMRVDLAREVDRYGYFRSAESPASPITVIEGRKQINLGSNNYLGLADDPRVQSASVKAVEQYGTGLTGSRLLNGSSRLHDEIEESLKDYYDVEDVIVTTTGFTANLACISGLFQKNDELLLDSESHPCLIDGATLSTATTRRFKHNDVDNLEKRIDIHGAPDGIVVEGIYSLHGETAPLAGFVDVAETHGCLLMVDEAHGLGTAGELGRGACEAAGVLDRVDLITLTFSKSLASCGGAILGNRDLIDYIRNTASPFLFAASNVPASIAAAHTALTLLRDNPSYVTEVNEKAVWFADMLREYEVPCTHEGSPIVTIPVGEDFRTQQLWKMAWNRGLYCNPFMSPGVAKGKGMLRMSVMRTHEPEHLKKAAEICSGLKGFLNKQDSA